MKYGKSFGNLIYNDFKHFHIQELANELDVIEKELPQEQLKQAYRVETDEELRQCIQERKQATAEVLQKTLNKSSLF